VVPQGGVQAEDGVGDGGPPGEGRLLRVMPGRRTLRIEGSGGPVVVKEFVGDEPRDWWFERLRRRRPRSPAEREHQALCALAELGLPVPRSLGAEDLDRPRRWIAPRPGGGPRSRLRLAWVEHGATLSEALATDADPRLVDAIESIVVRMHQHGWYHRDLYLGHLVLDGSRRPVLLDLGRARRQRSPRRRWFVKDLAALHLSSPPTVSRPVRLRFLRRWLAQVRGVSPSDRRTRRRWVRLISAKRRALSAHPPRFDGVERVP
jgi:hypothetical protein